MGLLARVISITWSKKLGAHTSLSVNEVENVNALRFNQSTCTKSTGKPCGTFFSICSESKSWKYLLVSGLANISSTSS